MSTLQQLIKEFKDLGFERSEALRLARIEIEREERRLVREERRQEREERRLVREERRLEREREDKRLEREREEKRQEREREEQRKKEGIVDVMKATAAKICIPFEENVLGDTDLLIAALNSSLLNTIPIGLRGIEDKSGLGEKTVFEQSTKDEAIFLVNAFSSFENFSYEISNDCTEANVTSCIIHITGPMWHRLASCVGLTRKFTYFHNKQDRRGATASRKRPDEICYLNDFLVSKSEHKKDKLTAAIQELTTKLIGYDHCEHPPKIVHLPVIAAAGMYVEFGVINLQKVVYNQVQRFDLREVKDRVKCFTTAINVFRLFCTMAPHIPVNPTRICGVIYNIKFCGDKAIKKITSDHTCPDELYELLRDQKVPFAVKVVKQTNQLEVSPIGMKTRTDGNGLQLEEVRNAIRSVLHCLEYIHAKNFVHRDVRWPNLIRTFKNRSDGSVESYEFLVIDFEYAAEDGAQMTIEGYIFSDIVPFMEKYNKRHDMKLVGKLVKTWGQSNRILLQEDAEDFIQKVECDEEPLDATAALNHRWLARKVIN